MKANQWRSILKLFARENRISEREEENIRCDEEFNTFEKTLNNLVSEVEPRPILRSDIQLWQQLKSRIELNVSHEEEHTWRPKHKYTYSFLRYAAVVVMTIGLTYLFTDKLTKWPWITQSNIDNYTTVNVKPMQRIQIRLTDGTTVMLDAGSEFRYPNEFSEIREVELKGEAFFEVAHDVSRPFIVNSGNASIEVLGTKFNVRNWDESSQVAVVVSEGKVKLQSVDQEENNYVILTKGLRSTLSDKNEFSQPEAVDTEEYLRWMHNEKVFRNVPVAEIFAQLERWYGYKFSISDSTISKQKITVELKASNVNSVLELISIITHTKIKRNLNHIKLISKSE